ncbi:MAG TPA: hypothetical protein VD886_06490 [Herpetosiphonaceae bacterium]|nr:hypothetical protein [Herpetosiphonaceae bacterium]
MNRWRGWWLVLVVTVLGGCDTYDPPLCYMPVLSLANPADLAGFTSEQTESGLAITNTGAPRTTFIVSSRYYAIPRIETSPGPRPGNAWRLTIERWNVNRTHNVLGPRYPDCGEAFTESYAFPITVIQGGQRSKADIKVSYALDVRELAQYEDYLQESARKQRQIDMIGTIMLIVMISGTIAIAICIVWAIKKLMTL